MKTPTWWWWAMGAAGAGATGWLGYWLWTRNNPFGGGAGVPGSIPTAFPVDGSTWPTRNLLEFGYTRSSEHTHQGIDIGAARNTPVRAVMGGEVVKTCSALCSGFSGYGRVVVVASPATDASPELWWLYAHLEKVSVSKGQRVEAGQQIATVGDSCFRKTGPTDRCKGPHLHIEASPRSYPQDSENWRYDPQGALDAIATQRWADIGTTRPAVAKTAVAGLGGW